MVTPCGKLMDKCEDCVFFLPHGWDRFNCGFLIKKVDKNSVRCAHFQSLNERKPPPILSQ